MPPNTLKLLRSYRHVYRTSLHAIQYSSPARHVLRKLVNNAYRSSAAEYDIEKIQNTILFLECAAKERGLEHKLLKTLIHTWYYRGYTKMMTVNQRPLKNEEQQTRISAFDHFETTLKMLNESMDMCLPTSARAALKDGLPEDEWCPY